MVRDLKRRGVDIPYPTLRDFARRLRPATRPTPEEVRFGTVPAKQAQCDWSTVGTILDEHAHLWQAILWPQVRTRVNATLSHYTALKLHELSDVNPEETHITVPRDLRIKRARPRFLVVHHADIAEHEIVFVDGLPTTSIERTLRDIATLGNAVVLHDALRDARVSNLTIPPELTNV